MPKIDIELEWLRFSLDTLYASGGSDIYWKYSYLLFSFFSCVRVRVYAFHLPSFYCYQFFSWNTENDWIELHSFAQTKARVLAWMKEEDLLVPTILFDRFLLHYAFFFFFSFRFLLAIFMVIFPLGSFRLVAKMACVSFLHVSWLLCHIFVCSMYFWSLHIISTDHIIPRNFNLFQFYIRCRHAMLLHAPCCYCRI